MYRRYVEQIWGEGAPTNIFQHSYTYKLQNSNVIEFYSLIIKDAKQKTFYNSGIGTYAAPSWKAPSYWIGIVENWLDLAFALCVRRPSAAKSFNQTTSIRRFEKIILEAYSWIADNYEKGDRIFLFGNITSPTPTR